jgi:hypothetical protein
VSRKELVSVGDRTGYLVSVPDGGASKFGGTPLTIRRGQELTVLESPRAGHSDTCTIALVRRDAPNEATPQVDPESATIDAPLVAKISFGSGNMVQGDVFCDWINGLLLTVPAGYFRVSCQYPATPSFTVDMPMFVGALMTLGARPPAAGVVSQARYTQRFGLGPGETELLRIPPRAHAVRLFTNRPELYGSFAVGFVDAINIGRAASWFVRPSSPTEEMPLGGANRAVSVSNGSALAGLFAVQWSISL